MGFGHAVRGTGVDLELGAFDPRGGRLPADLEGHDLVVVAVDDQRRHVERVEVGAEVGGGERRDGLVGVAVARLHALVPERVAYPPGRVGAGAVGAEERPVGEVAVELGTVGEGSRPEAVEHLDRHPARVVGRAQHERGHRRDECDLHDPAGAVPADVAGDFPAAGGEADEGDLAQIEFFDQRGEVVGVGVHVVAVPGLSGPSVAAAVVGDAAVAVGGQEQHLRLPAVGIQRPAVAEHDRLSLAPVLVEDLVPSLTVIAGMTGSSCRCRRGRLHRARGPAA